MDILLPLLPDDLIRTPDSGLSQAEAKERIKEHRNNVQSFSDGPSPLKILARNGLTFFNLLHVMLAILLLLAGSYRNMLFMLTVLTNLVIGTVQEIRAYHTLKKLKLMNRSLIHVVREGKEYSLPPEETVVGDIIRLQAGSQVPADCMLLAGRISVDESLLTGESDAIEKCPGDLLLSGSFLVSGHATAQQVFVGDDSYASKLTHEAKKLKRPKSLLLTEMNRLLRLISYLLVPLGLLQYAKHTLSAGQTFQEAIPPVVASVVGMIPSGLAVLISLALTVSIIRLGQKETLVQELYAVEAMARCDTLCLDKTGTITTGRMYTEKLLPVSVSLSEGKQLLSGLLSATGDNNPTALALKTDLPEHECTAAAALSFSSERKYSAFSLADGSTVALGAPQFVWKKPLPESTADTIQCYTLQGYRVLLLCRGKGLLHQDQIPEMTEILMLCVLGDEIRQDAAETLAAFRRDQVDIRVISGDDPRTVSAIVHRLGLPSADQYLDCSQLNEEQLRAAAREVTVFGRVTPQQKKLLVEALKAEGHTIAMTGDGVNDIPAMKAADCSIAMATGSDAARHAAQITLLDCHFSSMPAIVLEGRRVVNNITRSASLFLVKTLYSFLLSLLSLGLGFAYPFMPIQLTLIAGLTIGIPSFLLTLEDDHRPIRGNFLKTTLTNALPAAIAVSGVITAVMMLAGTNIPLMTRFTLCGASAAFSGLLMLYSVCYPFNRLRGTVAAGMTLSFMLAVLFVGKMFYIDPCSLTGPSLFMAAACFAGCICLFMTAKIMIRSFASHES